MMGHVMVNGVSADRVVYHTPEGLLYRENTADLRTLKEIDRSYGWLDVSGCQVLDIGAHIGGFSRWAFDHGAMYVAAIEPDRCNFELLQENLKGAENSAYLCRAAVVESVPPVKTTLWYTSRGFSHGMNSTQKMRGRVGIEVPAVAFSSLLEDEPEVVKIDCEGAEYQFGLNGVNLPDCVRQVAIEIHLNRRDWRSNLAPKLIESFSGWQTIVEPRITRSNWATIAGWRR